MKCVRIWIVSFLLCSCETGENASAPKEFEQYSLELLATNFEFTEGPAWSTDGYLIFSDINGDKILKWSESNGVTLFLTPVGHSNGIACIGSEFVVCRHQARDIAILTSMGILSSYKTTYLEKKFNSPNDVAVSDCGNVYFTDPDYGVNPIDRELQFEGVFWINSITQLIQVVDSTMIKPNGIALSPDQSKLYVSESSSNRIYVFDLDLHGTPSNKRLFSQVSGDGEVDGIECHKNETLFVAFGSGGVVTISPMGQQTGVISFPPKERVRNICFGNRDGNTLFVTAGRSLYKVEFIYL